jgi:hypothetical protein
MKRTLFALAMLALVCPAWQRAKGDAEVNVDFFYNNISGGNWIEVGDYGYCWQPDVAVSNADWRPYSDGYWAYTDLGWTWVSYEDFGWATYHYGRWVRLADQGWVWAPGRDEELEWGPAWVSWRTGGDYIGWAPLPPEVTVREGVVLSGQMDAEFEVGPAYYNFIETRYIGEPVLRERIFASSQNVTYIQQTVNVTNISYRNKVVYNYGPDIKVINSRASRPVQQLHIDRQQNVDFSAAAKSGALTKVQGDKLVVAAPMRISKSTKSTAPPNLKTKVDKAKIDRGWSAVGDEKAQTEFKQKISSQDSSKIPPPTGAGASGQAAASASPGGAGATGQIGASPAASAGADTSLQTEKGKGKNRAGEKLESNAGVSASASPATGVAPAVGSSTAGAADMAEGGRGQGKHPGKTGDQFQQNAVSGAASPAQSTSGAGEGAGQGGAKRDRKNQLDQTMPAQPQGQAGDVSGGQGQGKQKGHRLEQQPVNSPAGAPDLQGQRGGGGKNRGQGQEPGQGTSLQPGGGGAPGGQGQGQGQAQGKQDGGKKNKGEASPVPSPQ